MKSTTLSPVKRGFTLIELIVVIAILAVLASVSYPVIMSMTDNAKISAASKQGLDIIQAVSNFKSDYNGSLPLQMDEEMLDSNNQVKLVTEPGKDGTLLRVLTAREEEDDYMINTNREVYLRSDLQEQKRDGLYEDEEGELGLYDAWGSPYYILLSDEREGCIDPFTDKPTRKSCIVFSLGPDAEGVPASFNENASTQRVKKSKRRMSAKERRAAAKAAKAAAEEDEELAEQILDNIYSWKKTKS